MIGDKSLKFYNQFQEQSNLYDTLDGDGFLKVLCFSYIEKWIGSASRLARIAFSDSQFKQCILSA